MIRNIYYKDKNWNKILCQIIKEVDVSDWNHPHAYDIELKID